MKNRLLGQTLISVLAGHGTALICLVLLSFLALSFEDPSSAVLPCALVSFGVGAIVTGIGVRKGGYGILGGLLGGFIFSLVPFITSFFGSASFFSWGRRLLLLFLAWVLVVAVSFLFPKNKKRKRRKKSIWAKKR